MKIKTGPQPRFKDADHYRRTLVECMKSALTEGKIASARQFTQQEAADRIAKKFNDHPVFDDRQIRKWNEDHDVRWLEFVKESWKKLTAGK